MLLHNLDNSFLAAYRPARLRFADTNGLPEALRPVWEDLRAQRIRLVVRRGYELLRNGELDEQDRAALLAALASAELDTGRSAAARQLAQESLHLVNGQWLARRILLALHLSEKDYGAALELLDGAAAVEHKEPWDEPLTQTDRNLLRAACSWMNHQWDEAAEHLTAAYPNGVASMPVFLQEDWFRLSFYRERPTDAADAADQLISEHSPEKADILIQMLVRKGWHKEALRLYRKIYDRDPTNELLRRRVVGLCIREGDVQEARRLMQLGALRLTV